MNIADRILYEDNHLMIVNKLAGEIVQGDKTQDIPLIDLIKKYIKERDQKPGNVFCGLVHRIDRPVSGCVIFAKTSKALSRMCEIVKNRQISKNYIALVENPPLIPQQTLVHYLYRNEKQNKTYVSLYEKKGFLRSELSYEIVKQFDHYTLLKIMLHTGRHHQIRAQLSAIGCCIKGDLKYGAKRSNKDGSISLHAYQVAFEHPISHLYIDVKAPLSGELAKIINGYF